jgi:hypothetical protein
MPEPSCVRARVPSTRWKRSNTPGTRRAVHRLAHWLRSGAISAPLAGRFLVAEEAAAPDPDGFSAPTQLQWLDLAGQPVAAPLPLGEAVHSVLHPQGVLLAPDGTSHVALVSLENDGFELELRSASPGRAPVALPLAARVTADLWTRLVLAEDGGLLVATYLEREDDAARARLGLEPAAQDLEVVIVSLTAAGALRGATVVPLGASALPGAVRLAGGSLYVAGEVPLALNERRGFVARIAVSPAGQLVVQQTLLFDHADSVRNVNDLLVLADGRILVSGEVGAMQASGGSVIGQSRAALFLCPAEFDRPPRVLEHGAGERRNSFGRLLAHGGRLFASAWLDAPRTHDADADPSQGYSHAAVFELEVR